MILSLLLSLLGPAIATPTPQPASTVYGSYGSLPVIIKVSTNAVCTTLRETVLPVGYIAKTNDAAFTDVKNRTLKVALSPLSGDKEFEMLAHHDQRDVAAVITNDDLAAKLIRESEKRYPGDKNPEIEAMRDELARIIDLQRQYNSIVDAVSGAYLDSLDDKTLYGGMYSQNGENVQTMRLMSKQDFINANRVLLGLAPFDQEPIAGSDPASQQSQILHSVDNPYTQPAPSVSPGAQAGAGQIDAELRDAEGRLQATAIAALRLCQAAEPSPKP